MIITCSSAVAAAEACGSKILARLDSARSERGSATMAVSGGTTPRIMFEWMARQPFEWNAIDLYWVDERCVPIDDSQSNYRMTKGALLDRIALPPERIHRVQTELPPAEAAAAYAAEIPMVFDVLQRGMGPDAHTASLFPGEPLIENHTEVAAAVWVEKMGQHRVTLLPKVLEAALLTVCLVTGTDKKEALDHVLNGPRDPTLYPAQISSSEMIWYVDSLALVGE